MEPNRFQIHHHQPSGSRSMAKILHISDLHFGPPYIPAVGDALCEIAPSLGAEAVVVSGDFTQRAKPEQFIQARDFLERLPDLPKFLIPGNHDVPLYRIYERLRHPLKWYQKYICSDLNPVLNLDGIVLVGLDSTSPRRAISNGRVHVAQLEHCRTAFSQAPDEAVRIVVAHHHFAPAHDLRRDQVMPKSRRAIDCFVDLEVEMILGGHLHRSYIGNSLDFYLGNHRDTGIIIIQCGTTTSSRGIGRERGKNSFNLIDIGPDTISVTHYLFIDKDGAFAPFSQHIFPRLGRILPDDRLKPFSQPIG